MIKAVFLYDALGLEGDFDASSRWFTRFKNRNDIHDIIVKGDLLNGNTESAKEFIAVFKTFVIDEGFLPQKFTMRMSPAYTRNGNAYQHRL